MCLFCAHIVSANRRKAADTSSRRGGNRGKTVTDFIDIDETAAVPFEASGNGDDGKIDTEPGDVESSGDDILEASGDFEPIELTACQLMREQILGRSSGNATVSRVLPGQFVPNCAPDGHFEIVQCHSSTGHCWCVSQIDGREVTGSRRRAPLKPSCSALGSSSAATTTLTSRRVTSTSSKTMTTTVSVPTQSSPTQRSFISNVWTTPQRTTTRTTRQPASTTTRVFEPSNKIHQIPNGVVESDIEVENDLDNNYIERPNVMIEPKARKLSLRSTIVGQPGILAGIIGAAVIVLLCLVLLVMFIIYRMHRKSQDPAIYYIDKPSRTTLQSSNKKAGYMKALDHDEYA